MSAWKDQIGGDHYKKLKIQPTEYIMANEIPFAEGNIIKYVTRWRDKGGLDDLRKAEHYIRLLIEFEEKNTWNPPASSFVQTQSMKDFIESRSITPSETGLPSLAERAPSVFSTWRSEHWPRES